MLVDALDIFGEYLMKAQGAVVVTEIFVVN